MTDNRLIPSSIQDASTLALNELIDRMGTLDITPLLIYMIDNVAAEALPHLAEQFHVTGLEGWALCDNEGDQRDLIQAAIAIHRKKGTPWAVKQALARIGYPDAGIIEHRENHAAWLAAGGELLDGTGLLNNDGDLSAPGGRFVFTTSHWAEYSIRLNIGDGAWSRSRQLEIRAMAQEYAPARCRLAAVITFAHLTWGAPILLAPAVGLIKTRFGRTPVPAFDTLNGDGIIGGETVVDLLDGSGWLDGNGGLEGTRPTGEPLDGGQMGLRLAIKMRLPMMATGGDRIETAETLGDIPLLDGGGLISGPLLDGLGPLDGFDDLSYPTLAHPDTCLDGTSNLGVLPGPAGVWFSGSQRIRRGSTQHTEVLQ